MRRVAVWLHNPRNTSRLHATLTIAWFVVAFPSMLTGLKDSTPYLVFLSVYAIVTGHFSSWQAVQAEKKVDAQPAN